jgi:hypothetical protein
LFDWRRRREQRQGSRSTLNERICVWPDGAEQVRESGDARQMFRASRAAVICETRRNGQIHQRICRCGQRLLRDSTSRKYPRRRWFVAPPFAQPKKRRGLHFRARPFEGVVSGVRLCGTFVTRLDSKGGLLDARLAPARRSLGAELTNACARCPSETDGADHDPGNYWGGSPTSPDSWCRWTCRL